MSENTDNHNHGNIVELNIQDEMKDCYLDYAMSVIVGRALPDVRDGLKPVHRRVLYAMHMLNNYHNKPYLKSARVVGDVIGKYHPHGDSAVYQAIVRLAQDFSMRYQIIDGQGNFGSIDGDNAAAMRYTEVRMRKLAEEMLKDIDKDTIDWQPNYDDSLQEPKVLPTRIPNLLINGSSGIAVGMATNIPPHNLTEIMNGAKQLLTHPEITVEELMSIIPGPDFPTGGSILGTAGIKSAYHNGKGIIKIRAKTDIEVGKNDKEKIIVNEIPYQVNKAKLIEKIAQLVSDKTVTGITDIRDESSKLGLRIVIDIKRGEQANVILNKLFKLTQLQVSFGIIFLSIHKGQPKVMSLKEQLSAFLNHRKEVVVRRTYFELKKAQEKAHLLEGLKTAVENIDEIVELIKTSQGPQEARINLITRYSLSEKQAQAVLDMRLQRLTGLERDKIIADYKAVLAEIERLQGILDSNQKVKEIVGEEIDSILEGYSDTRKTSIEANQEEILDEDLISNEEVIVTITHKGYVKRLPIDTYKSQKRGGKGVKGASNEGDFFTSIFTTETHDQILFFSNLGNVYTLKVYQIPEGSRTSKGRNIVNMLPLKSGEKIQEIITLSKNTDLKDKYLMFATAKGLVKKTALEDYSNVRANGLRAIKITDGDLLVNVRVCNNDQDVLICATSGKIIRFSNKDCRTMGRVSQGVKGISLFESEKVVGMEIINDGVEILSVTENGYGKRTISSEYRKQSRGGKGIMAGKLTSKTGEIVSIKPVSEKDDLMIITNTGQVIRTKISGISLQGRVSQGVRLINLNSGEKVVAIENFIESDEE